MVGIVPLAQCASSGSLPGTDDKVLKEKRRKIKEALEQGKVLRVTPQGNLATNPNEPGTIVPERKLASFYWYDADPDLYNAEVEAMRRYFPAFRLDKESDGRLSWIGQVTPDLIGGQPRTYTLKVVYDHSHPSNTTFGGSIKVYLVDPDLEKVPQGNRMPYTLRDSDNKLYICTAGKEDFKAGTTAGSTVTTAAVAIGGAVKWLSVFELWLNDGLSGDRLKP